MYILAVLAAVIMIVLILIFSRGSGRRRSYIMVVNYTGNETSDQILRCMGRTKYTVRSKVLRYEDAEMTLQVDCKTDNLAFAERIKTLSHVKDVTLVEINGEYHG